MTPVAVPSLVDEGPEDAPAPTLPTAAKPPEPEAPLPIEPPSVALAPVLALDGPGADAADVPPAAVVEQSVTEAMKPESPQRDAVAEVLAQAPEKPAEKVAEGSDAAGADRGAALADEPSGTLSGESELAKETASASPTQASQADASDDASPPIEADEPVQENASAAVYDEQSVDQPIAFDKMARPKPSAVSRRLKEAGTVRIRIEVDAQGRLLGYEVLDATEHPRLLAAALSALEDSTFVAARRGDEAVRSTRVIEYRF